MRYQFVDCRWDIGDAERGREHPAGVGEVGLVLRASARAKIARSGDVAERSKAAVLKTAEGETPP